MRALPGTAVLLLSMACCGGAYGAETVTVTASDYRPMVETSNGAVASCGLAFTIAVINAAGQVFDLQGSFSLAYPGGEEPAVLFKLSVIEAKTGQAGSRSVASASLFDNDRIETSGFAAGTSQGAFSSSARRSQAPDAFSELQSDILAGQIWLAFNLGGSSDDYNLRLPPVGAERSGLPADMLACNAKAMDGSSAGSP
jgi:hypothetical protein